MANILAVDDSASMRQMVAFTLKGAGHQVTEAADGQAALDLAKRQKFDLVLSDVNMPRMDGITLARELRALPAFKFTRKARPPAPPAGSSSPSIPNSCCRPLKK